ncbi:MAG TPA: phage major capsid protein [Terracidiphilus sp.]|nr:phage major capsid protein [Terracidiphilus sp.]
MNLHELRAERAEVFAQAEKLANAAKASGKDLTGAERQQFNGLTAEIRELDAAIARCEQVGASRFANGIAPVVPNAPIATNNGLQSQLREVYNRATPQQREQINGIASYLMGRGFEASADLTPSGDGGVVIPSFVVPSLERNYAQFAPVVGVARIWATDTGADTVFPVLSDSESAEQVASAAATGADATVSGNTPPTALTGPTLKAYKISSKPVFVPRETFTDSPIDIVSEIIGALLARIIRFENLKYTKGNGTTEAEGFLTNCATYATGAVALDLDIALDLAYDVPALYRPNGVYMASDTTIKYLRSLKTGLSGDKRALWKEVYEEGNATLGTPARLHGYPIIVNNDMDSVASDGTFAGVSPLAFGDFSRFLVRKAENNQPFAYRYPVPAKDGSAAILFRRSDSKLLVPSAISKVVVS